MTDIQLSDFFENEYVDFSTYDNVRKIASYIDGLKNASRKILHTVREQNINTFTKVSNLGPKVQDYTQYLHGSLEGTIVNVAADYVGSGNNIPMLEGDGNFGSAFIPSPAASRYIFARQNPILKELFVKADTILLEHQEFEGDKIEPKFYVPIIPMLLVNGSEGMSIGFAQKILPRDPKELIKWVQNKATGSRKRVNLTPFWNGQTFNVVTGETPNQWIIKGTFERNTKNRLTITSIPVNYSLKQYQAVLDKLVDDKVIRNYDDLSDEDVFKFEVSVDKDFSVKDDEWILTKLKLVKTISENYTCIDENNKIIQFDSVEAILNAWYKKRMEYNAKRREYIVSTLMTENMNLQMRLNFIRGVVYGHIELRNRTEAQVTEDIEKYDSKLLANIKEYMNLPMRSITNEEMKKLKKKIEENKIELDLWSSSTNEDITNSDLKNLQAVL